MRSYTVTWSAHRARRICGTREFYRWLKHRAHRLDRREWHAYLRQFGPLGGDETAERHLSIPKATSHDVA